HNGLRSMHQHIGPEYQRVRLGIGHPGHKDRVSAYVLHDFAKADAGWLDDVLRGIGDGAPDLADGEASRFMNAIARRVIPERPSKPANPEKPTPVETPVPDTRSAFQKLKDKFG
ncbi:MAG: aminoacyl-tRNA hydrolase, partial [Paracoccaceae bacterium]